MAHACSEAYRRLHALIEAVDDDVATATAILDAVHAAGDGATDGAMLDLLAEADWLGDTLLMRATWNGTPGIYKVLVARLVEVAHGDVDGEVARRLLLQTSMDGWTVLHYLAHHNCGGIAWPVKDLVGLLGMHTFRQLASMTTTGKVRGAE